MGSCSMKKHAIFLLHYSSTSFPVVNFEFYEYFETLSVL
jgi:hypothetical protein